MGSEDALPESMLNTVIRSGVIHESGVMLGTGEVIVVDDRVPVLKAVRSLFRSSSLSRSSRNGLPTS